MSTNQWLILAIIVALIFSKFALNQEAAYQRWERWKQLPVSHNIEVRE